MTTPILALRVTVVKGFEQHLEKGKSCSSSHFRAVQHDYMAYPCQLSGRSNNINLPLHLDHLQSPVAHVGCCHGDFQLCQHYTPFPGVSPLGFVQ